ncbi:unnamed protein product, partial [Gulo gulo]
LRLGLSNPARTQPRSSSFPGSGLRPALGQKGEEARTVRSCRESCRLETPPRGVLVRTPCLLLLKFLQVLNWVFPGASWTQRARAPQSCV